MKAIVILFLCCMAAPLTAQQATSEGDARTRRPFPEQRTTASSAVAAAAATPLALPDVVKAAKPQAAPAVAPAHSVLIVPLPRAAARAEKVARRL